MRARPDRACAQEIPRRGGGEPQAGCRRCPQQSPASPARTREAAVTELDHQTPVEACAGCLDRRTVLRGAGAIGAVVAGAGALEACGSAGDTASSAASQVVGSATDAAKNAVKSAQV